MDEHIAGCQDCYEVFSETVQFGLADREAEGVMRAGARPASIRPTFIAAAGLAAAAVLVLGLGFWFQQERSNRVPVPLVTELAEAMGDRRFVEPRLTGGFRHSRLITLRAGEAQRGLDAQSPAVLAAVARIRAQAQQDTSPAVLGALGVTYLVSGDATAAIKRLESATAQAPNDARLLSDLAAAYLVRASQADEPADIPKALEAAERAIALKDAPPEAWFNRALALEGLHLVDAARKAWEDYLQRDDSSGWADEARQHLEALSKAHQSSAEEDKARARAVLVQGAAAIDRLADESPSLLRDYFEDELLPAWAEAHLAGHPDATLHRERGRLVGDALLRTTSDRLPQDTIRALAEPLPTATARDPLRSQAGGHRTLHEAKRLYDLQESSCSQFRAAIRELTAGGSPYAGWARLQAVGACLPESGHQAAMVELSRLQSFAEPSGYVQLLGRVGWAQGVIHVRRGELTESLVSYQGAGAKFETSRSTGSEAVIHGLIAENLHLLGESRAAWRDRLRGLARLSDVRTPGLRQAILSESVLACIDQRMPRTALHFENKILETAVPSSSEVLVAETLAQRAAIHHALGAHELAASDLLETRAWIRRISDKSWAERLQAEADIKEGEALVGQQPETAAPFLEQSLSYFRANAPFRVPVIHLLLGRAEIARGFDDAAEGQLLAGVEAMERERFSLRDAALQRAFFDEALPLFDEMVRLQVTKRHDPERALAFVERRHARQLVDSLVGAAVRPFEPEALRRELPRGLALVYYVPLEDRLFMWTLSRDGCDFIERPLPAAELSRLVAANQAAIEGRLSKEAVRRASARLHDELVRPLIPFIASQRALVLIPEGVLQSLAFASLWDRQTGRYLVEDYLLGLAPSGTVFVRASGGAAPAHRRPGALVVGNPQLDGHLWVGMPNLPGAEAEAGEIALLYDRSELLTGKGATKAAFLSGIRDSEVVHYAGHAAASGDAPLAARLLFAPDPRTHDSGTLFLHELQPGSLRRTRVVVLGACRSAAGAVSRVEGALSLARPFLAAGASDVVGSLWDIDDSLSVRFFVAFHRALLTDGDAVLALRTAQMALLRDDDASLAHPASWAGFICMGGLDPLSLSKGEQS